MPERQVFIVGCYRSGTSVMRLILSVHPRIYISQETNYIDRIGAILNSFGNLEERANLLRLHREIRSYLVGERWDPLPNFWELVEWTRSYGHSYSSIVTFYGTWGAWREGREELLYWGDNTPRYIHSMTFLKHLFPQAKFIHMLRDPRDVVASASQLPLGGKSVLGIAYDWEKALLSGLAAEACWGAQGILRVRYEDLVANPKETMERICEFLEVEFYPGMLNFHMTEAARELSRLRHHRRVSSPLDKKAVGRYKTDLPPNAVLLIESYLSESMTFMGYLPDSDKERLLGLRLKRPAAFWARLGGEALLRILSSVKDIMAQRILGTRR